VMQSTLLVIRPGHRWLRATTTVRQHQANGSTHLHPKPIRVPVPVRRIAIPVVFASAECSRGLPFRRQVVELSIGFDFFRGKQRWNAPKPVAADKRSPLRHKHLRQFQWSPAEALAAWPAKQGNL